MSLLGNRGRFTKDDNLSLNAEMNEFNSVISLIGKNPTKFLNISYNQNTKESIKDKLKNVNFDLHNEKEYNSHQEYNERLKRNNSYENYSIAKNKPKSLTKKRKTSVKTIIAMFVVEFIALIGIYFVGSVYRYTNLVQKVVYNPEKVKNPEISPETIKIMKGYKTVAVFGVDSRTGSVDKGNNADVNLIINLNLETGDAQLISVYRDLYLSVTDNNTYDKLNAAYRRGGPEQAVKTLNKNFDLDIDSYFAFNWKAVADGIELLGGIDLEISRSEFTYMNAFIHETCIATGIDAKNPAAHYIKKTGMQHLDGVQAVAYGRLRLMDSDFQRVERQKKVIALCLQKAKTLDIPKLRLIIEAVLPQIAYAFDMKEMLSLLNIVRTVNITESSGCPDVNSVVSMSMGGSGDCVVPLNLERSVIKLHKLLFNVDDYSPTNSVKRYSNRITELRVKYTEENQINESIKESSRLESLIDLTKSAVDETKRKSSRSATPSNVKSTSQVSVPNDLNIVDADIYAEEPENDQTTNNNDLNVPVNRETTSNQDNSVIQNAPGSNDYIVYDAPGVPRSATQETTINISPSASNNSIAPGSQTSNNSFAPGSQTSNNSQGVVVSGPPGSSDLNIISPGSTTNENPQEIVPIIGAPY